MANPFPPTGFNSRERSILETTSRVASVFSLVGAGFIITTFCTSKSFHKPINRLAFFASFGNIVTNVGTITSLDGIRAGQNSALCQAQATIIQWAIPADALFCLAMALNLYLAVFKKKSTQQLRYLEPYYIAGCYGLPMVPAIVFLFIKTEVKGRVYGPATLWCWISDKWQVLRIPVFYGPVWIVLITTFFIYVITGRVIFIHRRNLRRFGSDVDMSDVEGRVRNLEGIGSDAVCNSTINTLGAAPRRPAARRRNNAAMEANIAAWAYCRCALLFFLALVVTWLPSSINRAYQLQHPADFRLYLAAALVLPAQGFWNGLIYVITTLPACKEYFKNIWRILRRPFNWDEKKIRMRRWRSGEVDMDTLRSRESSVGGNQ